MKNIQFFNFYLMSIIFLLFQMHFLIHTFIRPYHFFYLFL